MRNAECQGGRRAANDLAFQFRISQSAFRIGSVAGGGVIRIIAGEFKGRRLKTPATDKVRPTGDRVREAWFSILQRSLRRARVLDLFAGTGALGLEALSRGAATADFVELHRLALASLKANIKTLAVRSEEHTSELQSRLHLVCRLLLEKKKNTALARDAQ